MKIKDNELFVKHVINKSKANYKKLMLVLQLSYSGFNNIFFDMH